MVTYTQVVKDTRLIAVFTVFAVAYAAYYGGNVTEFPCEFSMLATEGLARLVFGLGLGWTGTRLYFLHLALEPEKKAHRAAVAMGILGVFNSMYGPTFLIHSTAAFYCFASYTIYVLEDPDTPTWQSYKLIVLVLLRVVVTTPIKGFFGVYIYFTSASMSLTELVAATKAHPTVHTMSLITAPFQWIHITLLMVGAFNNLQRKAAIRDQLDTQTVTIDPKKPE